jgi:hypothetical protein
MHPNFGPRRRHSTEFKSKVLAACAEPGASISGVALAQVHKPDINLHLSTLGPHAVGIHARVNTGSAQWVRSRSAPTDLQS